MRSCSRRSSSGSEYQLHGSVPCAVLEAKPATTLQGEVMDSTGHRTRAYKPNRELRLAASTHRCWVQGEPSDQLGLRPEAAFGAWTDERVAAQLHSLRCGI